MSRVILHVDMNAFFATCEQLENPHLRGKPIVVGGQTSRSVVSTASYEARAFGVRSAMPIYRAKQLCPGLIIVDHHFDLYLRYSERFLAILSDYTNLIEVASIDECYKIHDIFYLTR
jgi:DNA polymerase-4